MASVIMFAGQGGKNGSSDSSGGGSGQSRRLEQLRVKEAAEEVVKKLAGSDSGFADFSPENNPKQIVWVNREHIRMIREV